mmetsp:Transcript_20562/g.33311  ORF Transcript_20562/g.33311 Transcript_20562/m.33311 type:complete len:283 (-) Transcript_20562:46-894(-)
MATHAGRAPLVALRSPHSSASASSSSSRAAPRQAVRGASTFSIGTSSSTSPCTSRGAKRAGVVRASADASAGTTLAPLTPEVVDAIALCNRRIEVVGTDLYKVTQEVTEAVSVMVASKSLEGGSMEAVLGASDGVWEVFHAPHMARMSSPLGVSFKPVRYVIKGNQLRTDVHFSGPGGVGGWLCSAGVVRASRDDAVEIVFDSFWMAEEGGAPRDNPVSADVARAGDRVVNSIGRLAFLSSLAVFPVHFFDSDAGICVFEFPPLNSYIATKLVGPVPADITF